ncbi:MAG: heavy metal translocating P-type ATPase [Terracidiphilus sp.]
MNGHLEKIRALSESASHAAVAVVILAGMVAAWMGPHLLGGSGVRAIILLVAIILTGIPLTVELIWQLAKGNFSVDILAFLSIVSAVALRQYWVAAIVILMLSGGKALEEYSTRRASSVLRALARRMPQIAHRIASEDRLEDISIEAVAVGDKLAIYPHELCPVDGVVIDGLGTMDESYLTGEPFLIAKAPGATVLSGSINGDAALRIQATNVASESRYAKIVEVLHASEENRPRIRRLGDRLGAFYTPGAIAIASMSWWLSGDPDRFLAVLVIATPCPLLLAIPVAIIGAVSVAARRGIVVKDPSILEKLDSCRTLIVDKTGTLTYGKPSLRDVVAAGRWTRRQLIQLAASLEKFSKHPLSSAMLQAAEDERIPLINPRDVSESPGHGLMGDIDGLRITLTGRGKIPASMQDQLADVEPGLECVMLINNQLAGLMRFHDQPRGESKPFLSHVESHHGIEQIVLLSGDRQAEVSFFAAGMGIEHVHGGKSPEEKVAIVRELTSRRKTLYLGDGINDAPAMMNATVGIALGVNSDITSEAAGAVILQSSLASVDELIHIGQRMRRIAMTSAIGGMLLSVIGMGAGALGFLAPIEGAILQEVIDLLSILNSLRMILPVKQIGDFTVPGGIHPTVPDKSSPSAMLQS